MSREIASVYYSPEDPKPRFTAGHALAETVLNHLGLTVTHFDLGQGLPKFDDPHEFRGILVWMEIDRLPDPEGFLAWLETQMNAGTRVALLGDWSFLQNLDGKIVSLARVKVIANMFSAPLDHRAGLFRTVMPYVLAAMNMTANGY